MVWMNGLSGELQELSEISVAAKSKPYASSTLNDYEMRVSATSGNEPKIILEFSPV